MTNYSFETGPIRPPSEAMSVLLRLTRSCPWNQCVFCPTFKNKKFSMRTAEEVKHDIDSIAFIADTVKEEVMAQGGLSFDSLRITAAEKGIEFSALEQVLYWMRYGMENLFLQDGDSLTMKTDDLVSILRHIRQKLPSIKRITTYARAASAARKSLDELKSLREAGLNRLHIGMESGSDPVLALIKKGVTRERQIIAGKNGIEAGFEVSLYFMPGIGGTEYSEDNALKSAEVINAVNPSFIRIRSVVPMPGTPLFQMIEQGLWTPTTERGRIDELELMIRHIDAEGAVLISDHIANLLEEVEGTFPQDKEKMLGVFRAFGEMSVKAQDNFILGRRLGRYRKLSDNNITPDMISLKKTLTAKYGSFENAMTALLQRYI